MPDPRQARVATFVEPRGMVRSAVAGATGGLIGAAVASAGTQGTSPLGKGAIAYFGVYDAEVVLFTAKRGAFKPKPTPEVIASVPRAAVRAARVDKGRLAGVLEIAFDDGSVWQFDVPRVNLAGAQQVAAALAGTF
ncbi:hypothetical protein FraEuI1c_3173 [Pseudofrankia inefficax]|uniref:Uncharacterized protein n=2 Tax=Pseudofrankia inefficax (strain DSM 45817 / CECT 9037 / DDB 130130 / EuI1c) TaxID=298654 RepID=E3ITZ5_PSEI1|nr:hypothetical protein FraEuI1c_3173 [Pseudofrankia inefficax]